MMILVKLVIVTALGVFMFYLSSSIQVYWIFNIANTITWTTYEGDIQWMSLFNEIPDIILYFTLGCLAFLYKSKFIWVFAVFAICLEFYFKFIITTEHTTSQTFFWFYFSHFVPSLSLLLGYGLKKQLTRHKNPPSARTRFQRARL